MENVIREFKNTYLSILVVFLVLTLTVCFVFTGLLITLSKEEGDLLFSVIVGIFIAMGALCSVVFLVWLVNFFRKRGIYWDSLRHVSEKLGIPFGEAEATLGEFLSHPEDIVIKRKDAVITGKILLIAGPFFKVPILILPEEVAWFYAQPRRGSAPVPIPASPLSLNVESTRGYEIVMHFAVPYKGIAAILFSKDRDWCLEQMKRLQELCPGAMVNDTGSNRLRWKDIEAYCKSFGLAKEGPFNTEEEI